MKLFDARPKVGGNPLEKLYTSLRRHPKLEKSFRQLAENSRERERVRERGAGERTDVASRSISRFGVPPPRREVQVDA